MSTGMRNTVPSVFTSGIVHCTGKDEESETFLVDDDDEEASDSSDSQMQWEKPLKRPR